MLGEAMHKTRSVCENINCDKPGKNDSNDWIKESLRMVGPDCDTKRTGPCKLKFSFDQNEDLPKHIVDRLAQIRELVLKKHKEVHG
jgi:hypothetical protein